MTPTVARAVCEAMETLRSSATVRKIAFCCKRDLWVTVTRQSKPHKGRRGETLIVTIGKPNWWAREHLKTGQMYPGTSWQFGWPKEAKDDAAKD